MKFTFKKLGPIKAAEMRLGNLTVIAGGNNTGKTYLAYSLYGFLRMMGDQDNLFTPPGMRYRMRILPGLMRRAREDSVEPRNVREVLSFNDVEEAVATAAKHLCDVFSRRGIEDVLSAEEHFRGFSFHWDVPPVKWEHFSAEKMTRREMRKMGFPASIAAIMGDAEFRREGDKVVYTAENARHDKKADKSVALGCIAGFMLSGFPEPFIVPAERFGVHLFYKELDFTKNRLVEMLQKLPDKGRRSVPMFIRDSSAQYAQPIKDYIDYARDMGQPVKRGMPIKQLHHSIEGMMGGHYERDEGNGISFVSKTKGKEAFRVPLHLASSSARGLAGFYFYLKHMARPGQLLIIDEPEAHLHPVNQMEIARLLARCVNAGLRVLITTHSDYIVKELNNLIMLSGDVQGKKAFVSKHKKTYGAADFLNKDDVRAYICEKGGLTQCDIDSRGMIMDSFNNPILEIDRISKELDARLPEEGE